MLTLRKLTFTDPEKIRELARRRTQFDRIQQGSALIERGVGRFGCQMIACYKW
jgi:hypothetical protein